MQGAGKPELKKERHANLPYRQDWGELSLHFDGLATGALIKGSTTIEAD
jgi:hypothetical protein